jgi:hypothetical protein
MSRRLMSSGGESVKQRMKRMEEGHSYDTSQQES